MEEAAHARLTLLALSQAAQPVQKTRKPEQVHQAVALQIVNLGYKSVILTLSADRAHLIVSSLPYLPAVTQAAENLTGILAQGYRFPLVEGGFFQRILAEGKTAFRDPGNGPIAEALPDPARPLAGYLAALLGVAQTIYAPLVVAGEVYGLLAVIGKGLTQADMPAVTVFANQASIALENALLDAQVLASRERLQLLSRQLLDAQEAERRSLALELHDRLGQDLTALKLQLQSIKQLQDWPAIKQRLDQGVASLEEGLQQVRDLSLELRPSVLDDLGLAAALRWYFDRQAQAAGIGVEFDLQELAVRPDEEIEITCFRVAQEALTNTLRHANARQVTWLCARKKTL
jgi:signal transduction histidine kinase